ncbi:hypothetical protein BFP70_06165 [Thioclava sp. SK-1]|uniref:hypothetical protein n=1 Tax=Thioclava sp. SK-1 TaxID=1889770 RepID=UPI0008268476|nr:hypothetical protein [Thioclava sp. SK-1]OCX66284.1 hypothetical protein BFP70_06165 [Thioclava sp. SK-1]
MCMNLYEDNARNVEIATGFAYRMQVEARSLMLLNATNRAVVLGSKQKTQAEGVTILGVFDFSMMRMCAARSGTDWCM